MPIKPVSVSQLNSYIKRVLGTDPILVSIAVSGEISGLTKQQSSGHWYFSLKDEYSKINCFLPSGRISSLKYEITEGIKITAYGNVSVYERNGSYSLQIKDIEVEGEGELQKAFNELKIKLEKEGLFDKAHKKDIPKEPKKIGVITSPTGAAVRDIITTIKRRNPSVDILIYPALVQGDGSADSICRGIEYLNSNYSNIDLLIVGRGGGSIEDLWSFNEEKVARCIYNSKLPIISAVGHEVDYVISDYVSDLRAPTPTAAAELAVPHIENLKDKLERYNPEKLFQFIEDKYEAYEYKLKILNTALESFNVNLVLNKGFALTFKNNDLIKFKNQLSKDDLIKIKYQDGEVYAKITEL